MIAPVPTRTKMLYPRRISTNGFNVLALDDSATVLNLISMILRRIPHLHLTAESSPTRALEILDQQADHFDLLITNYHMPLLNGAELAHQAKQTNPSLKIIGITTTPEPIKLNPDFNSILAKPFNPGDLINLVSNQMPKIHNHPTTQPDRPRALAPGTFQSTAAHIAPCQYECNRTPLHHVHRRTATTEIAG